MLVILNLDKLFYSALKSFINVLNKQMLYSTTIIKYIFFWYLIYMFLLVELWERVSNSCISVHFLLTENISRDKQGIIE
jgi:hypothetical protein